MATLGIDHFLFLSAALFIIGMMGVLIRRNLLIIFMCVELMVTAANISLVAFGNETNSLSGQTFAIFTIAVAAAEAAVGLAIIMALSRRSKAAIDVDEMRTLRD
jgi:NADH-quinone oxidoreductase subunit K